MKEHQVVGVGRQILILMWKNGLLFRRNKLGTICEILVALLFVFILVFLRFFVDSTHFDDQDFRRNPTVPVISNINVTTNRSLIMYWPDNVFVQSVVSNAYDLIKAQKPDFNASVMASNVADAKDLNYSVTENLFAFVVFPNSYTSLASLPKNLEYTVQSQELAKSTYNVFANFYEKSNFLYSDSPQSYCFSNQYFSLYKTIFNPIKHAIDLTLINFITGSNLTNPSQVKTSQFYCPSYDNDLFKTRFSFFPLVLIEIAYLFTLVVNVGNIIVEKQSKMKEYLKLVGIKWYVMWITWLIRILLPYMILTILFSLIGIAKLKPRLSGASYVYKAIFYYTNFTVAFSLFFVYSVQVAMFTLMIGQIFSKTFAAKIFTILFWLITAIDFYSSLKPSSVKFLFCIIPNAALQFAFQVINQYERSGISLSYGELYKNLYDDPQNLGMILFFMIFWTLVYIPITWYVERIFPGEYGAPLPFYFPFMPSYWFDKKKVEDSAQEKKPQTLEHGFEKDPSGLNVSISIENLSKEFTFGFNKKKRVVDDLSINFYEDQITGLLGHNGAGKTTTTFMLCGIYAPSSGDAFVLGKSIRNSMNDIRSRLGFCPQHDILYDELTVSEHLDLVASIKGYSKDEIKEEIFNISKFVGLEKDLSKKSKELSGGMKRRLSVAMALTGGSKIIILDEPTSGLDPFNRRSLWELIRKFKKGRSIVLTTHFMEEADALSDRIAIMNHGKVKCCGTPLFLKNAFGSGFRLTMAKNAVFDLDKFQPALQALVEKYFVETNIAAEITVTIPFSLSSKLPKLLENIEANKSSYGIDGYGISSPSIEEVFIKVGSIDVESDKPNEPHKEIGFKENENLSNVFSNDVNKNSGVVFLLEQTKSLIVKRFRIFFRRYVIAFLILALPFLLEAVFSSIIPSQTNLINSLKGINTNVGSYVLSTGNYSKHTLPYYINGSSAYATTQSILTNYYSSSKMSGVQLLNMQTDTVNDYVLTLRRQNVKNIINDYFVGLSLNQTNSTYLEAIVYYSTLAFHSSANVLNDIDNILLAMLTNDPTKSISTTNKPIAANGSLSSNNYLEVLACIDSLPVSLLDFLNSLIVALLVGFMVIHPGRERLNGSKQLQYLSGTHYAIYWLSNYLFDLAVYIFGISSMVIALKLINGIKNDSSIEIYPIASDNTLGYFYLLLFISTFAWCSFAYVWSFFFKSEIVCFVVLAIFLGFMAFLDVILVFLQLLITDGSTGNAGSRLVRAFRIIIALVFPNVNLKRGMYNLKIKSNSYCIDNVNKYLAESFTYNTDPISFSEPGIGLQLLFCLIEFIIFNLILFLREQRVFSNLCAAKPSARTVSPDLSVESDVQQEKNRIKNADLSALAEKEPLVIYELMKKFKKNKMDFIAVNRLTFGVANKECFGLLGLNGAGKTTTFKILTGETNATTGKAFVNGYDIVKDQFKARQNLSFCPQFDYLPEYLTVKETLKLFAGLRGLESNVIESVITDLLRVFKIEEFTDKLVQNLSGGNKRKVSSALCFIGRPSVVILDEPTTGMDPAARRYLWTVIKKARDSGMTIVLTTHSMEECEALATRLGIMVNGQFKCLGSVQHLKNKFGKGYTLILKCKSSNSDESVNRALDFVKQNIKFSQLKDKQQDTLFYQITNENANSDEKIQSIAELFNLIESNKDALNLETYSLSQTTLEQVFLSFAREQKDEDYYKELANKRRQSQISNQDVI